MKLKTVNYIHNLLIENKRITNEARQIASKAKRKAREENAENYMTLKGVYDRAFDTWQSASNALEDFENQEW